MEHHFTHNNHFKWGYNKRWFTERVKQQDRFTVMFGACEREPMSFKEECFDVARKIDNYAYMMGTSIELMFSGGSESEVMLRSFIEQDIKVNVNIMTYEYNTRITRLVFWPFTHW